MHLALYKATRPGLAGIYNRLVRWIDGGPYSHAELVLSDGTARSASYMDGGVRSKRITFDPAKWDMVQLQGFDESKARAWFVAHDGARYDVAGNLRFVLRFWPHSRSRWFCTEAIVAALGLPKPEDYGPRKLAEAMTAMLARVDVDGGPNDPEPPP